MRKILSDDFSHRHLVGICTDNHEHHTLSSVIDSISTGDVWTTRAGAFEETITLAERCPHPDCTLAPYIQTRPRSPRKDNLENLDLC